MGRADVGGVVCATPCKGGVDVVVGGVAWVDTWVDSCD